MSNWEVTNEPWIAREDVIKRRAWVHEVEATTLRYVEATITKVLVVVSTSCSRLSLCH